jgi:tetratricopeptide (TPR) repeat protein
MRTRCSSLLALAVTSQLIAVPPSSPADARIAAAQSRVGTNAKSWQPYNDLAAALCRKARDTEDVALYEQADAALQRSLELSPGNYEARKLQAVALLGKHQFDQALKLAAELNHKVPDDIGGWGLLADINVALGNYPEAEQDAQVILDLRPGSALGFVKAAGLRELFGDPEGAVEFYREANRRISQNDADEHAWFLTQIARLELGAGNLKLAEDTLAQALRLFPESQQALAVLAKLRVAQGNSKEAAALLEKRYRMVGSPQNLYDWAESLERAGQKEAAAAAFREFEVKARAQGGNPYNANRQLVFLYIDQKNERDKALTLATKEITVRHDSATLDAYAWALYANGKYSEAKLQMDRALAVGVREPLYYCHAARIAAKANDAASVAKFENALAGFGPNACPVERLSQMAQEITR